MRRKLVLEQGLQVIESPGGGGEGHRNLSVSVWLLTLMSNFSDGNRDLGTQKYNAPPHFSHSSSLPTHLSSLLLTLLPNSSLPVSPINPKSKPRGAWLSTVSHTTFPPRRPQSFLTRSNTLSKPAPTITATTGGVAGVKAETLKREGETGRVPGSRRVGSKAREKVWRSGCTSFSIGEAE